MPNQPLTLIPLDTVQAQPVDWLWYPYLPFGKISILQGDPGEGKTMLALTLVSLLTRGLPLPEQESSHPPITVLYQTAEDGLADTIKPRLEQAGADCKRVVVIDDSNNPLCLSDDRIETAIRTTGARLLILDPLQAFLGAGVDMHRANEVRPAFRRLAEVAGRTGCAVVIIGHLNKMSGAKGIYRGLGSVDIPAIARSILCVGRTSEFRFVGQLKNSLAPMGDTLTFEIEGKLAFTGKSKLSAEQLLSGMSELRETKLDTCIQALHSFLQEGERPANETYHHCFAQGIGKRTVDAAKQTLGIRSRRHGGQWHWSLG